MSNIHSYDARVSTFSWDLAREALGWSDGDVLNIGAMCSDRICERGGGDRAALHWQGFGGATRDYTFDDLRRLSNAYARFLTDLGAEPGDRVCIFMDRIPDLYISFLGILKVGAVAQPLFSAFGEESLEVRLRDAGTRVVLTTQKHVKKVRKIREGLPELRHVVVVDGDGGKLKPGETHFDVDGFPAVEEFPVFHAEEHSPSVLHYTSGTTGQPKGRAARARVGVGPGAHHELGSRPHPRRRLLVHRRPRVGHGHQLRHHRSVVARRHAVRARRRVSPRNLVPLHRRQPNNGLVLGPNRHPLADARGEPPA